MTDKGWSVTRWFDKQPVGVRTALIAAVALLASVAGAEIMRERYEREARVEERRLVTRKTLALEIIPEYRRLSDLSLSIAVSLKLTGEPNSIMVDSLRHLVEQLLVTESGVHQSIDRAYTASLGELYERTSLTADSLVHALLVLHVTDRRRTSPEALNELKDEILRRTVATSRLSASTFNALIVER